MRGSANAFQIVWPCMEATASRNCSKIELFCQRQLQVERAAKQGGSPIGVIGQLVACSVLDLERIGHSPRDSLRWPQPVRARKCLVGCPQYKCPLTCCEGDLPHRDCCRACCAPRCTEAAAPTASPTGEAAASLRPGTGVWLATRCLALVTLPSPSSRCPSPTGCTPSRVARVSSCVS